MKLIAFLLASVSLLPLAAADVTIVDNDETITVDCATDPNVSIMGNHITVTLTGTCKKIMIAGNDSTLTGSSIAVTISGNDNTATLDAVDSVLLAGNDNTATYKTTVSAKLKKPRLGSPGNGNKITRTK